MIFEDELLTKLYAIPFLLALVLPGWRTLVVVALSGTALFAWAWTHPGDGPGAGLGLALISCIALGLFTGLATRAVTLVVAPLRNRPLHFAVIAIAGFFSTPFLYAGPEQFFRWVPSAIVARL